MRSASHAIARRKNANRAEEIEQLRLEIGELRALAGVPEPGQALQ